MHDVVLLGKAYIQVRDQVVGKKGNRLWSPALGYTVEDLEKDLATPLAGSKPVDPQVKAGEKESAGKIKTSDTLQDAPAAVDHFDTLTLSSSTYHVGDTVYLSARLVVF